MAKLSQVDLTDLNQIMEQRTPQEMLAWASSVFGQRVAIMSAMQQAGSVVCQMASAAKLPLKVLFVDTGVHFQETLDTRDRMISDYGLEVITLHPEKTMAEQTDELGVLYLTPDGQATCCDLRKTQPLMKATGDYDALISSLRRADGGRRGNVPILSIDTNTQTIKINVLANMDDSAFNEYILRNNVIINPLHEQGFSTIGCNRCTTPVLPDEEKRAGRWRHLGPWAMYCGINPTDVNRGGTPAIELPSELIDRILGRTDDFMI